MAEQARQAKAESRTRRDDGTRLASKSTSADRKGGYADGAYFKKPWLSALASFLVFCSPATALLLGQTTVREHIYAGDQLRAVETYSSPGSPGDLFPACGIEVTSDYPLVIERSEYTDGYVGGEMIYNAFGANLNALTSPSATWYFADINTTLYRNRITLMNPSSVATAVVSMTFFRTGESPTVQQVVLSPGQVRSLYLNSYAPLANRDMSLAVSASQPILAEKSIAWSGMMRGQVVETLGGAGLPGAPSALTQWYFGEGSTAGWELTYVAMNPLTTSASVTFKYLREIAGSPYYQTFTLAPGTKRTIIVDDLIPFDNVSLVATATSPVVVERILHWNADVAGETVFRVGGHDAMGVGQPQYTWYLAEGSTAGWRMWVALMNPNSSTAPVLISWMREGADLINEWYYLNPNSRRTIEVARVPGLEFANVSVKVQAQLPIVAERSMYWDSQMSFGLIYNSDGHNSFGVTNPATQWWTLATNKSYRTWLVVMNPNPQTANLTLRFTDEAGNLSSRSYAVAGQRRLTVQLDLLW